MARKSKRKNPRARLASHESPAHDFIIYRIGMLRRLLDRYSGPRLTEQSGLLVAEWRVLTHLYSASPMTASDLRRRNHADRAEVSRACASLIDKGLIGRRDDPNDARSGLLFITAAGTRMHDKIIPLRRALENELRGVLSAGEVAALRTITDKLTSYLSAKTNASGA
jgi:DNA-binding MarR family transcriptional regulator